MKVEVESLDRVRKNIEVILDDEKVNEVFARVRAEGRLELGEGAGHHDPARPGGCSRR